MHEVLKKIYWNLKNLCLFQFLRWSSCRTSWSERPPTPTWPLSVWRKRILGPSTTGCTRGACSCPLPSTPWLPTSTVTGPGCASPSTTSPRETSATTGVSPRTLWGRPRDPSGCTVSSSQIFCGVQEVHWYYTNRCLVYGGSIRFRVRCTLRCDFEKICVSP